MTSMDLTCALLGARERGALERLADVAGVSVPAMAAALLENALRALRETGAAADGVTPLRDIAGKAVAMARLGGGDHA